MALRTCSKKMVATAPKGIKDTRTLSPSKYGYHPRSQSPTFKRLVAASERLLERHHKECQVTTPDPGCLQECQCGSARSYRHLKQSLFIANNVKNGYQTNDSFETLDTGHFRNQRIKLKNREDCGIINKQKISGMAIPRQTNGERRINSFRSYRHDVSQESARSSSEDRTIVKGDARIKANPKVGNDHKRRENHGKQLHFFLPQLVDVTSDDSWESLTKLHFHQEEHLNVSSRSEKQREHEEGYPLLDSNHSTIKENNSQISEKFSKVLNSPKHHTEKAAEDGARNALKKSTNARDSKQGQLSSNESQLSSTRDELFRRKRQVFLPRTRQKPERKKTTPSYPVRTVPYWETHLPSEMLKKQLEDFPTLVSMNHSDLEISIPLR